MESKGPAAARDPGPSQSPYHDHLTAARQEYHLQQLRQLYEVGEEFEDEFFNLGPVDIPHVIRTLRETWGSIIHAVCLLALVVSVPPLLCYLTHWSGPWRILAAFVAAIGSLAAKKPLRNVVSAWSSYRNKTQNNEQQQQQLQDKKAKELFTGSQTVMGSHNSASSSSRSAVSTCAVCLDAAACWGFTHQGNNVVHLCMCAQCATTLRRKGQLLDCIYCKQPAQQLVQVIGS